MKLIKYFSYILIAVIVGAATTYAIGSLQPSSAPASSQYSLNDIYNKLTDFTATSTEKSGVISVPGSITTSFRTLSEIMGLLHDAESDIVPGNIAAGVSIFGIEGTLESAPAPIEWQDPAPDLFLCLSADTECATHDNPNLTDEGYGAKEYCENLSDDGGGWRLPTLNELAIRLSSYESDEAAGFLPYATYWSSTEGSEDGSTQWTLNMFLYSANNTSTSFSDRVRCVR